MVNKNWVQASEFDVAVLELLAVFGVDKTAEIICLITHQRKDASFIKGLRVSLMQIQSKIETLDNDEPNPAA